MNSRPSIESIYSRARLMKSDFSDHPESPGEDRPKRSHRSLCDQPLPSPQMQKLETSMRSRTESHTQRDQDVIFFWDFAFSRSPTSGFTGSACPCASLFGSAKEPAEPRDELSARITVGRLRKQVTDLQGLRASLECIDHRWRQVLLSFAARIASDPDRKTVLQASCRA
jgi:hypothetical protein